MTLTFSSPRNLTESLCRKDESIPLIEEPIGTALLRAADRYGQQIALVDGALDVDNRRSWTFEALASDAKRVRTRFWNGSRPVTTLPCGLPTAQIGF